MWEATADVAYGNEELGYFVDMLKHTGVNTFAIGTPTVMTPAMEIWSNKSTFTGREIIPSWMSDLAPGVQAKPWTSESLKIIGEKLNISPLKMETFIRGYTATIGTGLLSLTDAMMEFRDDVNTPRKYFHEYIGMDRFLTSRVKSTKYGTRYYEYANEITEFANTVNFYMANGDYEMAVKMAKERPDYKARKNYVNAVNRQLSNVRQQEKMVWSNKTMSRDAKRTALEKLQTQRNKIHKAAYENGNLSKQ